LFASYSILDSKKPAQVLKEKNKKVFCMSNIDETIKAFNDMLLGIDVGVNRNEPKHTPIAGLFDVRVNISILGFDDLFYEGSRRPIYPQLNKSEPMIDVIEDKETQIGRAHV